MTYTILRGILFSPIRTGGKMETGLCEPDQDYWRIVTDPNREVSQEQHLMRFRQIVEFMIDQARAKSKLAYSYRPFDVGSAVFAYNAKASLGEQWKVFYGANTKIKKDAPKECAERNAVNAARFSGYDLVIGIVVVGTPQANEVGVLHPTLRPCEVCVQTYSILPMVKDWTVIITAHLEEDGIREKFEFQELWKEFESRQ